MSTRATLRWSAGGVLAAMLSTGLDAANTTRVSTRSGALERTLLLRHTAPGSSIPDEPWLRWGMTLLPVGFEPLAVSRTGVVLGRVNNTFHRWTPADQTLLDLGAPVYEGASIYQADINARGDIAIQRYDWSRDPGWDVDWERASIDIWDADALVKREYRPPHYSYSYEWDCSIPMRASLERVRLYRLDDAGSLWVSSIARLDEWECGTYDIEGLFRVDEGGARYRIGKDGASFLTVSRSGIPGYVQFWEGLGKVTYVLNDREVPFYPAFIAENGSWIGHDRNSNGDPIAVGYPDGRTGALPADVARDVWFSNGNGDWSYRVWIDSSGAIHGRVTVDGYGRGPWAAWIPQPSSDGASIPGTYERVPYEMLELPDDWTATELCPLARGGASFDWYFAMREPTVPPGYADPVVGFAERDGERRAFLYVAPPVRLAVDGNRDGQIEFGADDATSAENPFRFWVNDDDDAEFDQNTAVYDEREQDDRLVDGSSRPDLEDELIDCERDLEDFARLWIYAKGSNPSFRSGDLKLALRWTSTGGTLPSIRLFRSVEIDGGSGYLFDEEIAYQQADWSRRTYQDPLVARGVVRGTDTLILPKELFANFGQAEAIAHVVFEACSEGTGNLQLVILDRSGVEIGDGPGVWMELHKPRRFVERFSCGEDSGGEVLTQVRMHPESGPLFAAPSRDEEKDYLLYVHGYNMQPSDKQRWLETTFKRLYWLGYKGRVGGFSMALHLWSHRPSVFRRE